MKRMMIIFWLLVFCAAGQLAWYWPQLPRDIVTAFDAEGFAGSWGSKAGFVQRNASILVLTVGVFQGLILMLFRNPGRWALIPDKQYWLEGGRRAATLAFVGRGILAMGIATLLLSMAITQVHLQANLLLEPQLDSRIPLILIGGYGVVIVAVILRTRRRFRGVRH